MEILCTLGPSTFDEKNIKRLTDLGVSLFRINLSHTKIVDLERLIGLIRSHSSVPICLDSEGAQVRTGDFEALNFLIEEGEVVRIPAKEVLGNRTQFNLYPLNIIAQIEIGDLISIDFNSVLGRVIGKSSEELKVKILNGGQVGRNKAVSLDRQISLYPMTDKDIQAMAIGRKLGITDVALSFANTASDVVEIRKHCLPGTRIISKVECVQALQNLDGIIQESDAILIDRGDLSREIPIETVPLFQKEIINHGKKYNKKVYVATNLLESMVLAPVPTRAEVSDIFNTIRDGAAGLVLAAETAIGKYPVECVSMVKKVYLNSMIELDISKPLNGMKDLLVDAHGGKLIQNFVELPEAELNALPRIRVDLETLLDCEQIAHGTFSPLTGFMDAKTFQSVLGSNRLPSGETWTLPVVLQVSEEQAKGLKGSERFLILDRLGNPHSLMHVREIYTMELNKVLEPWFATTDPQHPGIRKVLSKGNIFVGGEIFLLSPATYQNKTLSLTPKQIRSVFLKKGWQEVVGFHTRNLPHRAHEFIQMEALKLSHADGLLISPVVGPKKTGDFLEDIVFEAYELAIQNGHFPKTKTLLSGFNSYSRYAGPREAIFTAICRQNMGCKYFIVGRDHTGVGKYYHPYSSHEIFESVNDLEIKPIYFKEIACNQQSMKFESVTDKESYHRISGTEVRDLIMRAVAPPSWLVGDDIVEYLRNQKAAGRSIFFE